MRVVEIEDNIIVVVPTSSLPVEPHMKIAGVEDHVVEVEDNILAPSEVHAEVLVEVAEGNIEKDGGLNEEKLLIIAEPSLLKQM